MSSYDIASFISRVTLLGKNSRVERSGTSVILTQQRHETDKTRYNHNCERNEPFLTQLYPIFFDICTFADVSELDTAAASSSI